MNAWLTCSATSCQGRRHTQPQTRPQRKTEEIYATRICMRATNSPEREYQIHQQQWMQAPGQIASVSRIPISDISIPINNLVQSYHKWITIRTTEIKQKNKVLRQSNHSNLSTNNGIRGPLNNCISHFHIVDGAKECIRLQTNIIKVTYEFSSVFFFF